MARSSVFRYKGPDVDPLAAGRALGVGAVVTGRVIHRGDALVVKVELVDLADDSQLWGEQYSRKMADALAIENEIATQISENLRLRLTGEERQNLARPATESTAVVSRRVGTRSMVIPGSKVCMVPSALSRQGA